MNEKSKNEVEIKKNWYWYMYIAGVLIVTVLIMLNNVTSRDYSIELEAGQQKGEYYEYTPNLSLTRGSYVFTVINGSGCIVTSPDGGILGSGNSVFSVELPRDYSRIIIMDKSGAVNNVSVHSEHAVFNDNILIALLFAALLIYAGYIKFKGRNLNNSIINIILIACAVFATYPVFTNYISYGQDLNFHLYRIEGLKDGMLSGQFPVRVDPTHNNGYGYISASVYPSLFLYFPAILRLCGMSLVLSYKVFLFAVNLATAFIMYKCAKEITGSKYSGLFAGIVYTLSTWRIVNLIYRAAIGEALAMVFFPVVILGLYYILKGDKTKWWVFTVGCSGIFNSHMISCIFVVMLGAVTIIVFINDFLKEKRYVAFIKSAVMTVLVNLWYLIPFLTFYKGVDLAINHVPENTEYFSNAVFPAEMFNFFNDKFGYSQLLPLGIPGNMSLSLGVGVTICLAVVTLYFIFEKNKVKNHSFYAVQFLFALFILFMTSTLFPNELFQKSKALNSVAGIIRMPWRFLSLASPIICIVASAVVFTRLKSGMQKKVALGAACILSMVSFVMFGSAYDYAFGKSVQLGQAAYTDGASGWDDEYFVHGTDVSELEPLKYVVSDDGVSINTYEKHGSNIELSVSGASDNSYIEVPLLHYPGYSAKDGDGNSLEIVCGTNNVLRVVLNDGVDTVKIKYSGMPGFKIGCLLSLLTFIGIIVYRFYPKFKSSNICTKNA